MPTSTQHPAFVVPTDPPPSYEAIMNLESPSSLPRSVEHQEGESSTALNRIIYGRPDTIPRRLPLSPTERRLLALRDAALASGDWRSAHAYITARLEHYSMEISGRGPEGATPDPPYQPWLLPESHPNYRPHWENIERAFRLQDIVINTPSMHRIEVEEIEHAENTRAQSNAAAEETERKQQRATMINLGKFNLGRFRSFARKKGAILPQSDSVSETVPIPSAQPDTTASGERVPAGKNGGRRWSGLIALFSFFRKFQNL